MIARNRDNRRERNVSLVAYPEANVIPTVVKMRTQRSQAPACDRSELPPSASCRLLTIAQGAVNERPLIEQPARHLIVSPPSGAIGIGFSSGPFAQSPLGWVA
jgi:hypothetical protein